MAKKKTTKKPKTLQIVDDSWKDRFQGAAFRTSFCLTLSQAMIEMLCAIADDVHWDRALYFDVTGRTRPDNWLASQAALFKRGLIVSKCEEDLDAMKRKRWETWEEWAANGQKWQLTEAGEAVVQLFKATGIFIEQDAAIIKKARA